MSDDTHILNLEGPAENVHTVEVAATSTSLKFDLAIPYLVLEWMDDSIASLLPRRHDLAWGSKLDLFRHVVKGVHQMHRRRIYHRDLKCDNALLRVERKNAYVVKVSDLGRSRKFPVAVRFSSESYVLGRGHILFAPPEYLWGLGVSGDEIAFQRADIFFLGSILYELATGSPITSGALGDVNALIREGLAIPDAQRTRAYLSRTGSLRAQFNSAFTIFRSEMPNHLKYESDRLLRQLCDPLPMRRDNSVKRGKVRSERGLNWLLNRVDILIKIDQVNSSGNAGRHMRRRAG
jgi:serine/threonine protein kinase